jgi:type IV secretory pathway component VirB8
MTPDQEPAMTPELEREIKYRLKIAQKVRSGEYFREARSMYDVTINDPMAERYVYVFITTCALMIFFIAYMAMDGLYPLQGAVPLIYLTHDLIEDIPHVRGLQRYKNEDPGDALLRFLVKNYTLQREEYTIASFDRNVNGVKSQSSDEVFKQFQQFIDPHNAQSPIKVYQRHSKRKVNVLSVRRSGDSAEVVFEAVVDSRTDVKKSHWRANVGFQYSGIELDGNSGTVKPMKFVVTEYNSKRLQDIK